jgi:hypothetical protein
MTLGLNKHLVHRLVDEAQKWLSRSGPEWTVKRLKDAKAYYMSKLADKEPEMATWWAKKGKVYRSPWLSLPSSSEKQIVQAMIACNAYTLLIHEGNIPTSAQLRKFFDSVEQEKSSLATSRETTSLMRELADLEDRRPILIEMTGLGDQLEATRSTRNRPTTQVASPRPFYEHIYSSTKKAPTVSKRQRDVESEMKWVSDNITSPAVMGLLYKYRGLSSSAGFTSVLHQAKISPAEAVGGGKISYIQEPGYKLRAVANPYRVHQVILEPLKSVIMRKLKAMPSDCTHDQREGALWAQAKLQEGRTLHAVDLSDATNNIPLAPQITALCHSLNLDMHDKTTSDQISYLIEVSRTSWLTQDGRTVRWSRGQPLGLGPSFGLFALWHNTTLALCHQASGSPYSQDDAYRIVGDDVVIACDATHRQYRKCLRHMDIPVSEAKCISSNKCTEFVGFVVTPDALYPIPKWKSPSDRNFMDVLKLLGPNGMSWLRPRQRRVAKLLAPIPEDFGGLGWNPRGLPLEDRVALAADLGLLDELPEVTPLQEQSRAAFTLINKVCLHGDVRMWNQHLSTVYGHHYRSTRPGSLNEPSKDIPEKVGLVGDNNPYFGDVDGFAPGPVISNGDPRGRTQLEILEQKLQENLRRVERGESPLTPLQVIEEADAEFLNQGTELHGDGDVTNHNSHATPKAKRAINRSKPNLDEPSI